MKKKRGLFLLMNKDQDALYMVVKDNELIQRASYNLTAEQQKFLCYVISKIKMTDQEFQRYEISILDFAQLIGIDKKNAYRDFKRMVDDFNLNSGRWIKINDDVIYFRVFSEAEYNERKGSVTVVLNSRLKKYLLGLGKGHYTQYELWNIISLKKKYSIRLYEIFKSYSYKENIEISVDDLRSLLCCESYEVFAMFKKRILDESVKEINEKTNLNISFDVIKHGKEHKAKSIIFHIKQKRSLEAYKTYMKTVNEINKKNNQIEGQISLFDFKEEDF